MPEKNLTGLVGRVTDLLSQMPPGFVFTASDALPGGQNAGTTAAERRVRLALRLAMLQSGAPPLPFVAEAAMPPAQPEASPPPEPPAARPKAMRVSMSTVRLEDAALLLAAASAPPDTEPAPHERPKAQTTLGGDLGDAFAALSALDADAPAPDPTPVAPPDQAEHPPLPVTPISRRRSASVSAADGMASAAAAFAAFDIDDASPAKAPSAAAAAMAAGFAAFDEPD